MALPPENEAKNIWRRQFRLSPLLSLLLLLIVALLLWSTIPFTIVGPKGARLKMTVAQIGAFKSALDLFKEENGFVPAGTNGLNDLVEKPTNASKDWHPYLDAIPLDPWGHPYLYVFPGKHNTNFHDLSSAGPDGVPGTKDDIANW
jgi:general secretion pathway protein G